MKVTLYSKTGCPWAAEVRELLKDRKVPYEERNVTMNPEYAREVEEKSGDVISPTLDIDGEIFADTDADEIAQVLEAKGVMK